MFRSVAFSQTTRTFHVIIHVITWNTRKRLTEGEVKEDIKNLYNRMKPDKPKRKNSPKQVSQCIPKSSTPSHFKPSSHESRSKVIQKWTVLCNYKF